jgi:hypothetical protein
MENSIALYSFSQDGFKCGAFYVALSLLLANGDVFPFFPVYWRRPRWQRRFRRRRDQLVLDGSFSFLHRRRRPEQRCRWRQQRVLEREEGRLKKMNEALVEYVPKRSSFFSSWELSSSSSLQLVTSESSLKMTTLWSVVLNDDGKAGGGGHDDDIW